MHFPRSFSVSVDFLYDQFNRKIFNVIIQIVMNLAQNSLY